MSDEVQEDQMERITVLAKDFTPAAMAYHRREMRRQGFALAGPIVPQRFFLTDGLGEPEPLLDGETYYAATFVRKKPADG